MEIRQEHLAARQGLPHECLPFRIKLSGSHAPANLTLGIQQQHRRVGEGLFQMS